MSSLMARKVIYQEPEFNVFWFGAISRVCLSGEDQYDVTELNACRARSAKIRKKIPASIE